MVAHTFNPSIGRQMQAISVSSRPVVYRVSSKTARAVIQRNPVSKTKQKTNKNIFTVNLV